MKEKIDKTLMRTLTSIPKENTASTSNENDDTSTEKRTLGDPDCPHCQGSGYLREDLPVSHPEFGRIRPCLCQQKNIVNNIRQDLYELSNLHNLGHLNFSNFDPNGQSNTTPEQRKSLENALHMSQTFAQNLDGWLLLQGDNGCGKTHLSAAIGNFAVDMGVPTLFTTAPDLLEMLRFSFNSTEVTYEETLNKIMNASLLIIDDFGTQNATPWAQEKLFQIINYRYINNLPLVITTNLTLDEIEGRIRSRLQDERLTTHVKILAPDYRRPNETSNPGISLLPLMREYTFGNFELREKEEGRVIHTSIVTRKEDKFGNTRSDIQHIQWTISSQNINSLRNTFEAALHFAEKPEHKWYLLLGIPGSGKTHLAAAIGNYRVGLGGQVILVGVSELLDYLRQTFNPTSLVSYDRRFYEVRNTPLLILDALGDRDISSSWAEEKLYQILNYRYLTRLSTVITSSKSLEELEMLYPSLVNRFLDSRLCEIQAIEMPAYRHFESSKKDSKHPIRTTVHKDTRKSRGK